MKRLNTNSPGPAEYNAVPINIYRESRNKLNVKFGTTRRHFNLKNCIHSFNHSGIKK